VQQKKGWQSASPFWCNSLSVLDRDTPIE